MPVLYFGGLALCFFGVGGSTEDVSATDDGPGTVGFLFCIPAIIKVSCGLSLARDRQDRAMARTSPKGLTPMRRSPATGRGNP